MSMDAVSKNIERVREELMRELSIEERPALPLVQYLDVEVIQYHSLPVPAEGESGLSL